MRTSHPISFPISLHVSLHFHDISLCFSLLALIYNSICFPYLSHSLCHYMCALLSLTLSVTTCVPSSLSFSPFLSFFLFLSLFLSPSLSLSLHLSLSLFLSHTLSPPLSTSLTHTRTHSDEQYHWIQNALQLRKVNIYSFGKMNFIHTVLSKRKLNWFVENKLVEGEKRNFVT